MFLCPLCNYNRSSDYDEIWYRERSDLGEENRQHFFVKKVNTRSKNGRHLNRDFEIYNGNFCL